MRTLSCVLIFTSIFSLPSGATSISDGVTIINNNGQDMEIQYSKDLSEIDWTSFSVAAGQSVTFFGPNSEHTHIHRVLGNTSSSISGHIYSSNSKGSFYLINPNGIVVDAGASISVGTLIASTLNLQSYAANSELTFEGQSIQGIVIEGSINATSGDIILLSNNVAIGSSGTTNSVVGFRGASAQKVLLKPTSVTGQRIFIETSSYDPAGPIAGVGVDISGTIQALETEIKANGNLYACAIKHSGTILANGCSTENGRILLEADSMGTLNGSVCIEDGQVGADYSSCSSGQGPTITIIGPDVLISGDSTIDASGQIGGGLIEIHDLDTSGVKIASQSIVAESLTSLLTNACISGNGGVQTYWAENTTFLGTLESQAILGSGNGGTITSTSVCSLGYDASSSNLSPGPTGSVYGTLSFIAPNLSVGSQDLSGAGSQITKGALNAALTNSNVELTASLGSLNVIDCMSWTSPTSITLTADEIYVGSSSQTHAYLAGFTASTGGAIIANPKNIMGVYAGGGQGFDAKLIAPTITIDSQANGGAQLYVYGSACASAYVGSSPGTISMGQTYTLNSLYVRGGCCNLANVGSIGSQSDSSTILVTCSNIIDVLGGTGTDCTGSIESSGAGDITLTSDTVNVSGGSDPGKVGSYNHGYIQTAGNLTITAGNLNVKGAQEGSLTLTGI